MLGNFAWRHSRSGLKSEGVFKVRNTSKLSGTQSRILCAIALLAVIALSMAACDLNSGGGGNNSGTTNPSPTNPGTTNPGTTNPGTTNPGTTNPGTTNPGTFNPDTTNPGTKNPGTTNPGTTNPGGANSGDTASISAFETWLLSQPANTAGTSYTYSLNVSDISAVGAVLKRAPNRYINLNLSGSTFTSVGNDTFRTCSNLVGVTLPNSVKSIGDFAFAATSITGFTLPNGVTSIGYYAFGLAGLTSLTLPNGVSIGALAFCFNNFTSITIPAGASIGEEAFLGCTSLASVTIETGITSIAPGAFAYCSNITSVTFLGPIHSSAFGYPASPFPGDLLEKFYATNLITGTPGTYTRATGGSVWTKQ